jgi:hypothetical protein
VSANVVTLGPQLRLTAVSVPLLAADIAKLTVTLAELEPGCDGDTSDLLTGPLTLDVTVLKLGLPSTITKNTAGPVRVLPASADDMSGRAEKMLVAVNVACVLLNQEVPFASACILS